MNRQMPLAVLLMVGGVFISTYGCENPYCKFDYLGGRNPIIFDVQVRVAANLDDWQREYLTFQHKWFCALYHAERAFFSNDRMKFAECRKEIIELEKSLVFGLKAPMHYGFVALLEISLLRMMQSDSNNGDMVNASVIVDLLPLWLVDSVSAGVEFWGSPRNVKRVILFRELMVIADSIIAYKRVHGFAPHSATDLYDISAKARSMKVLYSSNGMSWRIFQDIDDGFADRARIFVPSVCELGGSVKTFTVQISDDFSFLRERLFYGNPIVGDNPKWACHVDHERTVVARGHPMQWGDGKSVESQVWGSGARTLMDMDL